MLLVTLKIGCMRFALAKIFQTRRDTLKKKINSFVHFMNEELIDKLINNVEDLFSRI